MIKYVNILLYLGMVTMNYLANSLPLNNQTTGEVSDSYSNLFAPAGITFVIWGVIYLLLAVYCVVQFTGAHQAIMQEIGWAFAATSLLNVAWIFAWHYEKLPLTLVLMLFMLLALIYINWSIRAMHFGLIKAAFGIYLGWICIATIANITAYLVSINWYGFGLSEEIWTIIMISIGFLIVIITQLKWNNPFIGLAVVWAFVGIAIKRQNDVQSIFFTALVGAALLGILVVMSFVRSHR